MQFDSWPLKIRNRPDFLACKQRKKYRWKALDEGYNFASDLIAIGGLQTKLCSSIVARVPIVGIPGLSLGSLKTECHLDVAPVERCKEYYKGEDGGFPQVRAVVSLVCPRLPWLVLTPKVLQLCTNHPMLLLCRFVWIIQACQFFLVPSRSFSTPLYPSKCCELGSGPNSLFFRCFQFGTHIWVCQRVALLGNASLFIMGFTRFLNEFGHFYLMKLFNSWWTGTSCYRQWFISLIPNETRLFSSEIQIYQTIHLLNN